MEINKRNSSEQIKIAIIIALSIVINFIMGIGWCSNLLLTERFPNKDMQKTLQFLHNDNCVGMTREECEIIFGMPERDLDSSIVCYPAGKFQLGLTDEYELYIYYDENNVVKAAEMREVTGR